MKVWVIFARAALAAVCSGAAGASGQSAPVPAIHWRVENPFRFFKDPRWTEFHRKAYAALAAGLQRDPSPHELEKALELGARGRGWVEQLMTLTGVSTVAEAVRQEPCWYRDSTCSDYVHPKEHAVLVSLPGVAGACRWFVDGRAALEAPCASEARLAIPYPEGAPVSVLADGMEQTVLKLKVEDKLVVGLGDSFASGEGNPDRAVRFDPRQAITYDSNPAAPDPWLVGFPARKGGYHAVRNPGGWRFTSDPAFKREAADWVHRPCHRSLYSQHLFAALYLAIRDREPHRAITFVHLGCTGAEIPLGLFHRWQGTETRGDQDPLAPHSGQLSALSRILCGSHPTRRARLRLRIFSAKAATENRDAWDNPHIEECPPEQARPIDLLFLSIGGNDVGFTGLLANATLKPDVVSKVLARFLHQNPYTSPVEAEKLSEVLRRHNYGVLGRVLREVFHIREPRRIVLSAYPLLAYETRHRLCPPGKRGMERSFSFEFNPAEAKKLEPVETKLLAVMRAAAEANGWSWVEAHRELFAGHGFCAIGGEPGDLGAWRLEMPRRWESGARDDFVAFAETAVFTDRRQATPAPVLRFAGELRTGFGPGVDWEPDGYSPDLYKPYMPRARWVRTPNDAFLTVNLHEDAVNPDVLMLTRFMAYSGAFHPTAEGHAVMAGALLDRVLQRGLLN